MDTRDNTLKIMPEDLADRDYMIPLDIGEVVIIKDYQFKIKRVDVDAQEVVLEGVGKVDVGAEMSKIQHKLKNFKAKGGLGG